MNINFMTDFKYVRPDEHDTAIGIMVCVVLGTAAWAIGGYLVSRL